MSILTTLLFTSPPATTVGMDMGTRRSSARVREDFRKVMHGNGILATPEIAHQMSRSRSGVHATLTRLVKEGLVRKVGDAPRGTDSRGRSFLPAVTWEWIGD